MASAPVSVVSPQGPAQPRTTVNLLSYVHLRNIHNSTGAGRVARQLTEHLALRDDVSLRILADAADYRRIVPQVGAPWDTFHYELFEAETSLQQARWFLTNRPAAESYWPQADVVFCTAESYVPVRKARLAVTLHDAAYFEDNAHLRNFNFAKTRFKWTLLYRKLARTVDLFHTVSHFSAERLGHFFPQIKSRLRVVHNAVSPIFFGDVPQAGKLYLAEQKLDSRPYILLPGGLHFRKNANLVLKAWPLLAERHPDLTLAVVNHSNPEYAAKIGAFGDSVRMLGFVSDEALQALYRGAQAVWFPSRYEGFGMPVLEAMASGAPVVASDSSSIPEVAGQAGLLVSPSAAADHVEALSSLLTSAALREAYARLGRIQAQQFTWARSAEDLQALFAGLV